MDNNLAKEYINQLEKLQEEYMRLIKGCTTSIDDCKSKTIKKVCDNVYIEKE